MARIGAARRLCKCRCGCKNLAVMGRPPYFCMACYREADADSDMPHGPRFPIPSDLNTKGESD